MKKIIHPLLLSILALFATSCSDDKTDTKQEVVIDLTKEESSIKEVLRTYKETLESLDVSESFRLFTEDSEVLEQGKIEGTYRDYIANHIGPELGHFESFKFSDYEISVIVDLPYAFTTETYVYNIVLKEDSRIVERKAAATSVLKKIDGNWRIIKTHSSSRATKKTP